MEARETSNLKVAGSSPAMSCVVYIFLLVKDVPHPHFACAIGFSK